MNWVELTSYQWRAIKSTVQPPPHAVRKSCNQVFPDGALEGAGDPNRIPCALNGSI